MGNAKIFIGERRKVGEGEKKLRYPVVGVAGTDLRIHAQHIRKMEIDQITGYDTLFQQRYKDTDYKRTKAG